MLCCMQFRQQAATVFATIPKNHSHLKTNTYENSRDFN